MEKLVRLTAEQRGNLVAYLDGELDESATAEIEQVLAASPVARREVDMLARTWDLVGSLPRATLSADFTHRTLSNVLVIDAPRAPQSKAITQSLRRGVVAAVWVVSLMCSAYLGYISTNRLIPNPSEDLLEALPIVERLDAYLEVRDVEFLRELKRRGTFHEQQDRQP